jgi:hypothetical protein
VVRSFFFEPQTVFFPIECGPAPFDQILYPRIAYFLFDKLIQEGLSIPNRDRNAINHYHQCIGHVFNSKTGPVSIIGLSDLDIYLPMATGSM